MTVTTQSKSHKKITTRLRNAVILMIAELILVPANADAALAPAKQCAQYVARSLATAGIKVREQITLCHSNKELQKATYTSLSRSNVVIVLGGLSKQQNYLSKVVIGSGLKLSLAENTACTDAIREYCKKTGEPFTKEDLNYAMLPQGSIAFPGQHGKIPGFAITSEKQNIILMPDSQTEAAAMMGKYIIPFLSGTQSQSTVTRTVRTYGVGTEQVRALLSGLMDTANPAVTVDKEDGEVLVRVSAHAVGNQQAAALCTPVLRDIVERLGDAAYGLDVDSLESALISKLTRKGLTIAVAEFGTDGTFSHVLSETQGGVKTLRHRVIAESNDEKSSKLGIDKKAISKKGSVSEWCAIAMADAARRKGGADIGLGICANTLDERNRKSPIGDVYIAVCDENNVYVKKLIVEIDDPMQRDLIIDAAVSRALNMARLFVDYLPRVYASAIPLAEALGGKSAVTESDHYEHDDPPANRQKKKKKTRNKTADKPAPKRGRRKQNIFQKIGSAFIIRKTDGKKTKVKKFIFILAVLVFLGSAGYVGRFYVNSFLAMQQARQFREMFTARTPYVELNRSDLPEGFPEEYLVNFADLWEINPDVVAFIDIPGTTVQYPIVQSGDNDFYLRRDFHGRRSEHGIPFMDFRADIRRPSDNLTVYGHNMRDGQIFGPILQYRDVEFYRNHPIIEFATLYEKHPFKIFAVFITNALPEQGEIFAYHDFVNARSREDFENFIHQVRIRSMLNIPVDVEPGDVLLTLSTCTYEFHEARFVVMARRVRPNESTAVNVMAAHPNPQPLFPDVWYETFGGSRPLGLDSMPVQTTSAQSRPADNEPDAEEESELPPSVPPSAPMPSAPASSAPAVTTPTPTVPPISSAPPPPPPPAEPEPLPETIPEDPEDDTVIDGTVIFDDDDDEDVEDAPPPPPEDGRFVDQDGNINLFLGLARDHSSVGFRINNHPPVNSGPSIFDGRDFDPRRNQQGSTFVPPTQTPQQGGTFVPPSNNSSVGTSRAAQDLRVMWNGQPVSADAQAIVERIVQIETGSDSFHVEALRAQAVAAYSFVLYHNTHGRTPNVLMAPASAVVPRVRAAVAEVIGQEVRFNGSVAFTTYFASSAGRTTSSQAVWGGAYPYLISVDSSIDRYAPNFRVAWAFPRTDVENRLRTRLGIQATGDPDTWFRVLEHIDGVYNGRMSVSGETVNRNTGAVITGRMLRENVFGLRSHSFDVQYDRANDRFIFTTRGHGHGVGMSQHGANLLAHNHGWNYVQILEHYFPGTRVV